MKSMRLPISFGATKSTSADDDNFFKTLNSVYFDSGDSDTTNIKGTEDDVDVDDDDYDVESIIRGAHMESRLFFEPSTAKSINSNETARLDCVALALESEDPYEDFRRSMEEMTALIKKGDWGCLEELLAWYLSVNSRNNHAYIIAAFVDLLLKISNDENSDHLNDMNEGFSSSSSRKSSSSSCASGELVLQPGKSSSASCFSSSSPSNSSLSQEQEKLIKLI